MSKQVNVLGYKVDNVTMDEALQRVEQYIQKRQPRHVVTINPEIIMSAETNDELHRALKKADLVVPDGSGVVWAARYTGQPLPERVAGYDLMQRMLALAAEKRYRVFLLGAAPGVAKQVALKITELYPGCTICGTQDGYFKDDEEAALIETIAQSGADMLFCALGPPRPAEIWIQRHMSSLNVPVSMGVGGSFNVMAGIVKRAPVWMQKVNLEWLHRALSDPKRIKRLAALPRFVMKVVRRGKKA
ncbi:MAG: WecB/TagA/CpsF family glycosyltransferase [Bacillota bacterium]